MENLITTLKKIPWTPTTILIAVVVIDIALTRIALWKLEKVE